MTMAALQTFAIRDALLWLVQIGWMRSGGRDGEWGGWSGRGCGRGLSF